MIEVHHADSRDALATMAEASVDSCVTDPPYGLKFMGKGWDGADAAAFDPDFWREVLRVLKPGAHLVAFGGTRTYHRLVCAIEDAGFEIRDQLAWVFGSGFPKSHDVSKGIDRRRDWTALPKFQENVRAARKALNISQSEAARRCGLIGMGEQLGGGGFMWFETGLRLPTRQLYNRLKESLFLGDECDDAFAAAEREVVGEHAEGSSPGGFGEHRFTFFSRHITAPATDAARQWQGWGTALKPAWEPICLARKPLIGTVAANVVKHGTGALNIDGCRIEAGDKGEWPITHRRHDDKTYTLQPVATDQSKGRWPANLLHDGSEEVMRAFPEADGAVSNGSKTGAGLAGSKTFAIHARPQLPGYADAGSAARFFYSVKADAADRLGSRHPTVKPVDLIAYLARLVTPPGGTILDPFAGSGTLGMAAMREGFNAVLIEREAEYITDIKRRLAHVKGEDAPLFMGSNASVG